MSEELPSDPWQPASVWILAIGFWSDEGDWIDDDVWIDAAIWEAVDG